MLKRRQTSVKNDELKVNLNLILIYIVIKTDVEMRVTIFVTLIS